MEGAGQVKKYLEEPKSVQPTALHLAQSAQGLATKVSICCHSGKVSEQCPGWKCLGWGFSSAMQSNSLSLPKAPQAGAGAGATEALLRHLLRESGSPSPHPLGANPEDLVLVRYNSPYLLKELFSS